MIGIFDSGVGGFVSLCRLKALCPREDICYLADRKNAPYGTKSAKELRRLVLRDLNILRLLGADKILAACCTASAIIDSMDADIRDKVTTIIKPTASTAVRRTKNGKIALLCTYATAKSAAFENAVLRINPDIEIKTQPSKRLVELAESGARDERCDKSALDTIRCELSSLSDFGADTVILGCTHFSLLRNIISDYLNADCISAADEGAELLASTLRGDGNGKILYTCPEKIL